MSAVTLRHDQLLFLPVCPSCVCVFEGRWGVGGSSSPFLESRAEIELLMNRVLNEQTHV